MKTIVIKSQKEWDELPSSFDECTIIENRAQDYITVLENPKNSELRNYGMLELYNNSHSENYDNSHSINWECSHSVNYDNSHSINWEFSHSVNYDNSHSTNWGNSHSRNYDNSHSINYINSHSKNYDNSHSRNWNNTHSENYDNSHSKNYDNSHSENRHNSHSKNYDNSHSRNWNNTHSENYDNSHSENRHNSYSINYQASITHLKSLNSKVVAYDNSVIFKYKDGKVEAHGENVNIISNIVEPSFDEWLERGIVYADGIWQDLVSQKTLGEVTIYQTKDHAGKTFYVARKGDKFAHAETAEKAKTDLRYKITDRDTTRFKDWKLTDTKKTDEIIEAYRAITGACETGVKMFCESINLKDEYKLSEIIDLTKDKYNHEQFAGFLKEGE